jgi:uncharacterized protein YegL
VSQYTHGSAFARAASRVAWLRELYGKTSASVREQTMEQSGSKTSMSSIGFACAAACVLCACSADDGQGGGARPVMRDMFANAAGMSGAAANGAFGNSGGSGASTAAVPGAAGAPPTTCAQGLANTMPITPTVWLVLDGSGSMNEEFDGGDSRWQVLRAALMSDDGLVPRLQQTVRFGMVLYSGIDADDQAQPGMCIELVTVTPELNNFDAIAAQFPDTELGGWTPTDRAIEHVVANLPVTNQQVLDAADGGPIYVILATDGAPNDRCAGDVDNNMGGGRGSGLDPVVAERVLAATEQGTAMGMRMFIISLAGDDDELQQHLEQVALATNPGEPPFVPSTQDALVQTFQQIVGAATCQIQLEGSVVPGKECSGRVTLNGSELACDSDDGWRLLDERTVQLTGAGCDMFLGASSMVHAEFPCDAFSPD